MWAHWCWKKQARFPRLVAPFFGREPVGGVDTAAKDLELTCASELKAVQMKRIFIVIQTQNHAVEREPKEWCEVAFALMKQEAIG